MRSPILRFVLVIAVLCPLLLLVASCESRPKNVLSKGEMRSVLYDYHLAQGMIESLPSGQSLSENHYLDAVFKKHGITVAEFDSSMIWYNAHAEELRDIYSDLKKDFSARNEEIELITGNSEMAAYTSVTGDTADIWTGPRTLLLRQRDILSLKQFTLKADTSFRANDKFRLLADVQFIDDATQDNSRSLTTALTLHNKDKKTFSDVRTTSQPLSFQLNISQSDSSKLGDVSVLLYFDTNTQGRSLCVVDNIRLIRMHQPVALPTSTAEPVPNDLSSKGETTDSGVQPILPPSHQTAPRLSPNELRKNTIDGKVNPRIKKAPAVRTPNSFGPVRKKKQN